MATAECNATIRRVLTRSGASVRGLYYSQKNDSMIPYESQLERDALANLEFDPTIVHFRMHQREVLVTTDDGAFRAFPDFEADLVDQSSAVLEVKVRAKAEEARRQQRFAALERHFAERGIDYRVFTDDQIYSEPRWTNIRLLDWLRRERVRRSLLECPAVRTFLDSNVDGSMSLAEVAAACGGWQTALSMIANDLLKADLETPVGGDAIVTPRRARVLQ